LSIHATRIAVLVHHPHARLARKAQNAALHVNVPQTRPFHASMELALVVQTPGISLAAVNVDAIRLLDWFAIAVYANARTRQQSSGTMESVPH